MFNVFLIFWKVFEWAWACGSWLGRGFGLDGGFGGLGEWARCVWVNVKCLAKNNF